jgi:hypothetical protein
MRCDIAFFICGAEMPAAAHSCVEAAVPLLVDLTAVAQMLPRAGSSRVLERFGGANFTVLRMGGVPDPDESHGHPEVCGAIAREQRLRIRKREHRGRAGMSGIGDTAGQGRGGVVNATDV